MKPYGHVEAVIGSVRKVHEHNICDACSGQPRSKTSTRMKVKRDILKDLRECVENSG